MKKFLAILLCVILSLGVLCACGEEASNSSQSSSSESSSTDTGIGEDVVLGGELKYQYDMTEYITLPEYEGYEIEIELDTVQQQIDRYLMDYAVASKRTICMTGDVVNVSYFGYRLDENGEVLYEGNAPVIYDESESYGVYLGSGLALAEFEKGIVGMKIGDIKEIYVTFPEDYFQEDLAGETVLFEIILNAIYEPDVYNDKFVQTNFSEYENTEEFEKSIRDELVLEKIYGYVSDGTAVKDYPEKEMQALTSELENMEESFLEQYNMTLDEYLNKTYKMTRDEYIKSEIKKEMIFYAIAQVQGIEPTEEQLNEEKNALISYYKKYYENRGASLSEALSMAKDIVSDLGKSYIYENVIYEKIDEKMLSLAKITEKPMTYQSVTQVLAQRERMETGSDIGELCPSYDMDVFGGLGLLDTTLDPSMNVGKLTVINFWGTWCPYCLDELPAFDRVAEEYAEQVTIFAVHSDNGYATASDYVLENFPDTKMIFLKDYVLDPYDPYSSGAYYDALGGSSYYPYTVILDENGIIQAKFVGAITYEKLIDALIQAGLQTN